MKNAGPERFGRYELVSRLGQGGMAETWRARLMGAAGVTKPVLIKKVLPEYANDDAFIRMFISEARISATLSHGNIAQVFDFGETDGDYFLAMELVDGQPLHRILQRARKSGLPCLPPTLATYIAMEMCRGLHYAHTRTDEGGRPLGIVHRDISPDNVLVSYESQVKIVDFGIAKARLQRGFNTEPGVVKGKYLFFSPEQSRGEEVDARTDVWATGVVLYQMACGRLPLEGPEYVVMNRLQGGALPHPRKLRPDLPEELDAIIMKALAMEREDRFESCMAFGDALAGFLYSSSPRFSSMPVAWLLRELFPQELARESRDTQVPVAFQEELARWRGTSSALAPPEPASRPPSPSQAQTWPLGTGRALSKRWALGGGALACLVAAGALLWADGGAPAPVQAPVPHRSPLTPLPPPPLAPAPAPQASRPEALPHASAVWPVQAVRLDARRDVLRISDGLVALMALDPKTTYSVKERPQSSLKRFGVMSRARPEERGALLPLLFLVSGSGRSAQDSLGTVSARTPLSLRGGTGLRLFTFGPPLPDEDLQTREVMLEDLATGRVRQLDVHVEYMTASADRAFLLSGLSRSATYQLTLAPVGEGAFTRGAEGGPIRKVACVQDGSPGVIPAELAPVPAIDVQRFLLEEGQPYRLRGVDALRCGFLDDDTSDNHGEAELLIEQVETKPATSSRGEVKRRTRPVEVRLPPARSMEDRLNEAVKTRLPPSSRSEQPTPPPPRGDDRPGDGKSIPFEDDPYAP